MKPELKLDWCSYQAAKYAVEHWHYSRVMPAGKLVKVGVWEGGEFIGAVVFSLGTNKAINKNFALPELSACELTRVALTKHDNFVSRIVSIAIKKLKMQSQGIRLIVSYADPFHSHVGGIYQAMNWVYIGDDNPDKRNRSYRNFETGDIATWRSMAAMLVKSEYPCNIDGARAIGWEPLELQNKHKYLYPLDPAMRAQIAPLAKPYPKRTPRGTGETDNAPQTNAETEGASPIVPL